MTTAFVFMEETLVVAAVVKSAVAMAAIITSLGSYTFIRPDQISYRIMYWVYCQVRYL
jgi:hypothetical protein